MKEVKKQINVRIEPELHKAVKQIALDNDITVQDYVKSLILTDIEKRKLELNRVEK